MILRIFLKNVKKHPEKIAFIKGDEEISYKDLAILSFRYAHLFKKKKIKRIITVLQNNFDHIALFISCLINRIEIMPLVENTNNLNFSKFSKKSDLILTKSNLEKLKRKLAVQDQTENKIFKKKNPLEKKFNYITTFTSGTTGISKIFKLSNINKYNRAYQSVKYFKFNKNDVFYMNTSLRFTISQRIMHTTIILGAKCILNNGFSILNLKRDVLKNSITRLYCLSNHIARLAYSDISQKNLKSLKTLISTSDTLHINIKKRLIKKFNFKIYEIYGTAEVGVVSALLIKNNSEISSVGNILKDTKLKIIDKNQISKIGKITFNSPRVYDNFKKKFFETGDLGYLKNNKLYFVGREKEIIRSNGIFVYPKLIENKLKSLSIIKECAVIGIENKYYGELIVAVLVVNKKINTEYFYHFCDKNLQRDQNPHLFFFENNLPKNQQEKIVKRALREKIIKKYKTIFEKFDVRI
tara:strand:+ start:3596 stop:4999 length:1404 start_codon:yes stop_codon:yes gene_type:complete